LGIIDLEAYNTTPRRRLGEFVFPAEGVGNDANLESSLVGRVREMAQCEVCGNEYDKAFSTPGTHAPPTLTVSLAS
jgi:hypothetical protein